MTRNEDRTRQTEITRPEWPRTDIGTVVLHWAAVIAMVTSLLTGLRISADTLSSHWAQRLSVILPQGEIWTIHILAGLALVATITAYGIYLRRAALGERNAPRRLRTIRQPTTRKLQWRAINIALHWLAYGAILILTISGIALYLGYAGWFLSIHNALAWATIVYIAIHVLAHAIYGGIGQLIRLFRPQALFENPKMAIWPLGISLLIASLAIGGLTVLDETTRPGITVSKVSEKPVLDGQLNEPFWKSAEVVEVLTHQGANLAGTGQSIVKVSAVQSETEIHFSFQWSDPTRSLMRTPLIKRNDGWHVLGTGIAEADVNDYYEDKFAVMFSRNNGFGGGESTFLGEDLLPEQASSPHGRGFHYTKDGRILDLWQWKASRGGMLGHIDDMYFGPPKQASTKERAGKKRYSAGYHPDPGKSIYEYNFTAGPNGYAAPVRLKRLPLSLAGQMRNLGKIPETADGHNDQGSIWWLTPENSVPYSVEHDAKLPTGTIIPGTLNIHEYQGDRASLSGGARWKDGWWTLEVSRSLDTGSPYDVSFLPGTRLYVWVSVFDHNQTRHTRHQRPVELYLPPLSTPPQNN